MQIAEKYVVLPSKKISISLFCGFLLLSVLTNFGIVTFKGDKFFMGAMACFSILGIFVAFFSDGEQRPIWGICAKYTMPVFLMHTLFAAPIRSALMKFGITNVLIHFLTGIIISFLGPIVAIIVMEKIKPMDFVVYPTRYIKLDNRL